MNKIFLPACIILIAVFSAGCISEQLAPLAKNNETCYKNSIGDFPYWYECNGKKVSQTVLNNLSSIENFTVFESEQRVFWEYRSAKGTNFYTNNFEANSLTILNIAPDSEKGEFITHFSAGGKSFMQILQETKHLPYILAKRDFRGNLVSQRIFSNSLTGDSSRELAQEQNSLQSIECVNYDNQKVFWFFSKTDAQENITKALYYSTLEGKKPVLASFVAKPCNEKQPGKKSSEIKSFEAKCSENTFYSKGDFAFWIYSDIWNSEKCNSASAIETVYATFLPEGIIKPLTQFARIDQGDYIETMPQGIDIDGNRIVWIYYSKDLEKSALYYNCLKGAGNPRMVDESRGKASKQTSFEKNTLHWEFEGKTYSAELQKCPN